MKTHLGKRRREHSWIKLIYLKRRTSYKDLENYLYYLLKINIFFTNQLLNAKMNHILKFIEDLIFIFSITQLPLIYLPSVTPL